jgi:class 3 adenylate cyclase
LFRSRRFARSSIKEQSAQSCIQTIIGRGYRFIAPVTRCAGGMDSHTPPGPHEHRRFFAQDRVHYSVPLANAHSPEPQPSSISPAERRQLTVMICELVGASELSARLDPEDLREVIAAYHRVVGEIVVRCDGLVGKYMGEYMGEAVLVYFGYPLAHENDAERAVRAGLSAIDAVGRLDIKSVKLQTRVGIATGLVVVGDFIGAGSAQEQTVVGETPHPRGPVESLGRAGRGRHRPKHALPGRQISSSIATSAPST